MKIYLIVASFISLGTVVFAQEMPFNQSSAINDQQLSSSVQSSSSDVIEIETEIGGTQIKSSDIVDKPKIKPRSDYSEGKPSVKKLPGVQYPAARNQPSLTPNHQPPTTNPQSLILNDQLPKSNVQRPTSSVQQPILSFQPPTETITDDQIVAMSTSLRKLIEDNSKLKNNLADLDQQLRTLRGQQMLDSNRLTEVSLERDALKKQNENIVAIGSQAEQRLQSVQQELTQKEQDYSLQIVRLQTELAQKLRDNESQQLQTSGVESLTSNSQPLATDKNRSVSVNLISVPNDEAAKKRGEKILLALDNVTQEQKKLAQDEAKVHYNMGNTYFNQGDYVKAADEYARTLELSPEDANAHYNLAFVGGEFLNDPKIALGHYKKYLFLNPNAEDAEMVRQKIVEAEISVKGDVHFKSKINEELRKKKNDTNIWD